MPAVNYAPARHESPKRKRTEGRSVTPVAQLRVETGLDGASEVEAGLDSPRSKVAERLERLDLRQQHGHVDGGGDAREEQAAPRKKLKTKRRATFNEDALAVQSTPARSVSHVPDQIEPPDGRSLEVLETPDCRQPVFGYPVSSNMLASPLPVHQSPVVQITPSKPGDSNPPTKVSPKRMRSPPPPEPSDERNPPISLPISDPQDRSTQDAGDAASLTWQDTEITGHEIDVAADDDGEGINGVGFRPTPAIAYARSQKRKQQVSEWRAREAREARQRRFQRRQGCSVDADGTVDETKVVRFAEFG